MTNKQKVVFSISGALIILIIIALSIAIILVAGQAVVSGSMHVTYKAENVDCIITSRAIKYEDFFNYKDSDTVTDILIFDGNNYTLSEKSLIVDAKNSVAIGNVQFDEAAISSRGRAVYIFTIKNTATEGAKDIVATLTISSKNANNTLGNIKVQVAETEYDAVREANYDLSAKYITTNIKAQDEKGAMIVVVMSVDNADEDARLEADVVIDVVQADQ